MLWNPSIPCKMSQLSLKSSLRTLLNPVRQCLWAVKWWLAELLLSIWDIFHPLKKGFSSLISCRPTWGTNRSETAVRIIVPNKSPAWLLGLPQTLKKAHCLENPPQSLQCSFNLATWESVSPQGYPYAMDTIGFAIRVSARPERKEKTKKMQTPSHPF